MKAAGNNEERSERAADLFAEFRLRQDDGETIELDAFIAEYPLFEKELREIERNERRLASLSGIFGLSGGLETAPVDIHPSSEAALAGEEASARPAAPPANSSRKDTDETPSKSDRPAPRRTKELIDGIKSRENPFVRYRIERKVGQGSMGEVFRVWDQDLRRTLAMKILSRGLTHRKPEDVDRTLTRFVAEAQVTSQLDHPGIVPVHEFGVSPDGQSYFTMKLVKGRELLSVIDEIHDATRYGTKTDWSLPRVLGLIVKVCEAMAYAHHKGVLHRDLKPTNIMVGRYGAVYVMDWGLARILGSDYQDVLLKDGDITFRVTSDRDALLKEAKEEHNKTRKGASVGTPVYMAPEQANGKTEFIDERADIYGIGAILYHLVAGHAPYLEPGKRIAVEAILFRVQQGPPVPIDSAAPDAPAELRSIIRTAMARSANTRFESMEQLGAELTAFLTGRDRAPAPSGPSRRTWILAAVGALVALAAGFAAGRL